MTSTHTRPA